MHVHDLFAAITFASGRRERTFFVKGWCLGLVAIVLPVIAAGYLGATAYLVWHDQLLASLMTRQSEMQYAYEDRIAALKSALDKETGRGNADRLMLETSLRDLALKSERLERRAGTIDDVVARLAPGRTATQPLSPIAIERVSIEPARRNGVPPGSGGLRLEDHAESGEAIFDTDTLMKSRAAHVAHSLDRLADRQALTLEALAGPTIGAVERMTAALAKTGLSFDRRHVSSDVGGPFVPLPVGRRDFEATIALMQEATVRQADLMRLVNRVPLRKPMQGPLDITSTFGARLDPFFGRPAMHTGIDLRQALGEPVTATAGGIVTIAGVDGGYGNLVEIDHGNGLRSRYAHLGSVAVAVDQKIESGAIVGRVGSTGRATGPHLHYEVRIDGEAVDPTRFLKAGADLFAG